MTPPKAAAPTVSDRAKAVCRMMNRLLNEEWIAGIEGAYSGDPQE